MCAPRAVVLTYVAQNPRPRGFPQLAISVACHHSLRLRRVDCTVGRRCVRWDDRQRVLSVCDDRSAYGRLLVPPPLSKSGQLGHGQQDGGIFQRLEAVTAIWHDKQVPPVGLPREVSG